MATESIKRNLILFSGGVESTAMLSISTPHDIILTIDWSNDNTLIPVYKYSAVTYITKYYNRKLIIYKYPLPEYSSANFTFLHQMRIFISVCNIWAAQDATIGSIWCGRNSAEPSHDIKEFIEQMMKAWNILHPNVSFDHPLDHLSKFEQYQLIDPKVRPFVSSCITHNKCKNCFKCMELTWI